MGDCVFDNDGHCTAFVCYSPEACNSRDKNGQPIYISLTKKKRNILTAHNLYFGTALKILNSIIRELQIEQEVKDCFDDDFGFRSQSKLELIIPELVRIEKEKCQCQKKSV